MPDDIRAIATKNAMPLRHESFDDNTENIVTAILGTSARNRAWEDKGRIWSKVAYAIAGAIAAAMLMFAGALMHFWTMARPVAASIGQPLTDVVLIAGLIAGVWMGLRHEARRRNLRYRAQ